MAIEFLAFVLGLAVPLLLLVRTLAFRMNAAVRQFANMPCPRRMQWEQMRNDVTNKAAQGSI